MKKLRSVTIFVIFIVVFAAALPLKANAAPVMSTADSIKVFHGKWISDRVVPDQDPIHQTLKIRCDTETNYCKMELITEQSRSCTAQFGEPTDALLKGEGFVEVVDQTIEIFVDAYCLSKPPTYSFSFPVTFTYNPDDDTLTDNLGTTWFRKIDYNNYE
jgi:hypothetical protein